MTAVDLATVACRHCTWSYSGDDVDEQRRRHELMHPGGTHTHTHTREEEVRVDVSAHDLVRTELCVHPGCDEEADVEDYCFFHARNAAPEAPPVESNGNGHVEISDPDLDQVVATTNGGKMNATPLWSRDQIIAAIVAWAKERGAPPVSTDWASAAPGRPSAGLVKRRFGSWADAIVAAGFDKPTRGGRAGGTAQKPKPAPAKAKPAAREAPRKSAAGPIPEPFRKSPETPGAPVVEESSTSLVELAEAVESARTDVHERRTALADALEACDDAEQRLREAIA